VNLSLIHPDSCNRASRGKKLSCAYIALTFENLEHWIIKGMEGEDFGLLYQKLFLLKRFTCAKFSSGNVLPNSCIPPSDQD
jgi:hypothetical protein